MISIKEKINIKADPNTIWAFLVDFSQSLGFNRFHQSLDLPADYSIGKMDTFIIHHNFGFGSYEMVAEIKECIPPRKLVISEFCQKNPEKGFPHEVEFNINNKNNLSELMYQVKGTYGNRVSDISFKPILKSIIKKELIRIKTAIESSEINGEIISTETFRPI